MKLICSLQFPDGQCVVAAMKADSPQEQSSIDYHGPIERLNWRPEMADPLDFKVFFRSLAREHRARMELQEEGGYKPKLEVGSKYEQEATDEEAEDVKVQQEFSCPLAQPEQPSM